MMSTVYGQVFFLVVVKEITDWAWAVWVFIPEIGPFMVSSIL